MNRLCLLLVLVISSLQVYSQLTPVVYDGVDTSSDFSYDAASNSLERTVSNNFLGIVHTKNILDSGSDGEISITIERQVQTKKFIGYTHPYSTSKKTSSLEYGFSISGSLIEVFYNGQNEGVVGVFSQNTSSFDLSLKVSNGGESVDYLVNGQSVLSYTNEEPRELRVSVMMKKQGALISNLLSTIPEFVPVTLEPGDPIKVGVAEGLEYYPEEERFEKLIDKSWSNAYVYSANVLELGSSGFVEYEITDESVGTDHLSLFGMAQKSATENGNSHFKFGFRLSRRKIRIVENGIIVKDIGAKISGTKLRIEFDATTNKASYLVNGFKAYETTVLVPVSYQVSAFLNEPNTNISNIRTDFPLQLDEYESVYYDKLLNMVQKRSLNSIEKIGETPSWTDNYAISLNSIQSNEDGIIRYVIPESKEAIRFGLVSTSRDIESASILDFGFYFSEENRRVHVFNNMSVFRLAGVRAVPGDVFEIAYLGSQGLVEFRKNGNVISSGVVSNNEKYIIKSIILMPGESVKNLRTNFPIMYPAVVSGIDPSSGNYSRVDYNFENNTIRRHVTTPSIGNASNEFPTGRFVPDANDQVVFEYTVDGDLESDWRIIMFDSNDDSGIFELDYAFFFGSSFNGNETNKFYIFHQSSIVLESSADQIQLGQKIKIVFDPTSVNYYLDDALLYQGERPIPEVLEFFSANGRIEGISFNDLRMSQPHSNFDLLTVEAVSETEAVARHQFYGEISDYEDFYWGDAYITKAQYDSNSAPTDPSYEKAFKKNYSNYYGQTPLSTAVHVPKEDGVDSKRVLFGYKPLPNFNQGVAIEEGGYYKSNVDDAKLVLNTAFTGESDEWISFKAGLSKGVDIGFADPETEEIIYGVHLDGNQLFPIEEGVKSDVSTEMFFEDQIYFEWNAGVLSIYNELNIISSSTLTAEDISSLHFQLGFSQAFSYIKDIYTSSLDTNEPIFAQYTSLKSKPSAYVTDVKKNYCFSFYNRKSNENETLNYAVYDRFHKNVSSEVSLSEGAVRIGNNEFCIDASELLVGGVYTLEVITPDGEKLYSKFRKQNSVIIGAVNTLQN